MTEAKNYTDNIKRNRELYRQSNQQFRYWK